jgi:phosphate:Na+ symporter
VAILGVALLCCTGPAIAGVPNTVGIPSAWSVLSVLALAGGMALLLVGMETLSDSLKTLAGGRMTTVLKRLTHNRVVALTMGAAVTALIQSSTATTVILVSLVEAKLMAFPQTIAIILGSNIGTTISAQILALRVTDYALLLIGVGFGVRSLIRRPSIRAAGMSVLGVGLAFFGLAIMSEAMRPLQGSPGFTNALRSIEAVPIGLLVGTVLTAVIHSSVATIGILIIFASQGLMTLEGSVPVILGANIGTCFTAVLASLPDSREAKRVAVAHTLFNVGGALLFMFWVPQFADLVRWVSLAGSADAAASVPRQIANAHTLFNVLVAGLFLPLTGPTAGLIKRVVPEGKPTALDYHLDRNLLVSFSVAPELALHQSLQAIERAVELTRDVLLETTRLVTAGEFPRADHIRERRLALNRLREDLTAYINEVSELRLSAEQSLEATNQALIMSELDHISQVLSTTAEELRGEAIEFSPEGRNELRDYCEATLTVFDAATKAFFARSLDMAREAGELKGNLKAKEDLYRRTHIARMHSGVEASVHTDTAHMDLLDALRQVNTYSGRIARLLEPEETQKTD